MSSCDSSARECSSTRKRATNEKRKGRHLFGAGPSVSGLPPRGSCLWANLPAPPVRVRFYCCPYALSSPGKCRRSRVSGHRAQTTSSVPWWFEESRQRVSMFVHWNSHQRGANNPTAVRGKRCCKRVNPFLGNDTHPPNIQPTFRSAKSRTNIRGEILRGAEESEDFVRADPQALAARVARTSA